MKLLLDTHLLLWAAGAPKKLSAAARRAIGDPRNTACFSAASLWEIAIKQSLGREDFRVDPGVLRRGLIENGYLEIPVDGEHAVAVGVLPPLHKDPFDRILLAQAVVEGMLLLTSDAQVAQYPGPVRKV
ncbi:MAG: type II toxin-antitoxin system VapC family toxin [Xanthomonadales bacterium]|nr:type II toxin-antitoxin system VapC family toxin [Xanthomonadales bacterium]